MTSNVLSLPGSWVTRSGAFQDSFLVESGARVMAPLSAMAWNDAVQIESYAFSSSDPRALRSPSSIARTGGLATAWLSGCAEREENGDTAQRIVDTGHARAQEEDGVDAGRTLTSASDTNPASAHAVSPEWSHAAVMLGIDVGVAVAARRFRTWVQGRDTSLKGVAKYGSYAAEAAVYVGLAMREISHWIDEHPGLVDSPWSHTAGVVAAEVAVIALMKKIKSFLKEHPVTNHPHWVLAAAYALEGTLFLGGGYYVSQEWGAPNLTELVFKYGDNVLKAAAVIIGAIAIVDWLKNLKADLQLIQENIKKLQKLLNPNLTKMDRVLSGLQGLVIAVSALLCLSVLGVDVPDILLSIGLSAVGLGMAFKDVLGNLIGYLVTKTFNAIPENDFIEIGGQRGHVITHDPVWLRLRHTQVNGVTKDIKVPGSALLGTPVVKPFGQDALIKGIEVGDHIQQVCEEGTYVGVVTENNTAEEYFVLRTWNDAKRIWENKVFYHALVNKYTHVNFKKEIPPLPEPLGKDVKVILDGKVETIVGYDLRYVELQNEKGERHFVSRASFGGEFFLPSEAKDGSTA